MPDITMCKNKSCIKNKICYRSTAEPDPFWQMVACFVPKSNNEESFECDYYMEMK